MEMAMESWGLVDLRQTTGGVSVTLTSHWLTYRLGNRAINRAKAEN